MATVRSRLLSNNSTQQFPAQGVSRHSAGQMFNRTLERPSFHYRVHKNH